MAHDFQPGQIVVWQGRLAGVLQRRSRSVLITLGADGPQHYVWVSKVRHATREEENEWNGVSGKQPGRPRKVQT